MDTDNSPLRQIQALNLRAQIENEVREAILRGVFKPGERLVESVIANQLGVSRAPVREVLAALEREGLVVNIPRRGNFVIDFTEKDIDEIYSLRLLLEIGAIRRAMRNAQARDFVAMQAIVDKLADAAENEADQLEIMKQDLSFHEFIYDLANHSRMRAIWNTIRQQTQLLIGLTTKTHAYRNQPAELHQKILDAFRARDLATAEEILSEHIIDAQQRAMTALMANGAYQNRLSNSVDEELVQEPESETIS